MLSQGVARYSPTMALIDLVTLPFRLGFAAPQVTLMLGELLGAAGPVRRRGGYAERLIALIGEGGYVERSARTLTDLAGRLPRTRRRAALAA